MNRFLMPINPARKRIVVLFGCITLLLCYGVSPSIAKAENTSIPPIFACDIQRIAIGDSVYLFEDADSSFDLDMIRLKEAESPEIWERSQSNIPSRGFTSSGF